MNNETPQPATGASETTRFFCTRISSAAGAADELKQHKKEPNMANKNTNPGGGKAAVPEDGCRIPGKGNRALPEISERTTIQGSTLSAEDAPGTAGDTPRNKAPLEKGNFFFQP